MTTSEKIKHLKELGISRYQIWKDTKIPQKTLGNWLHGSTENPQPFMVEAFDRYYENKVATITES